MTVTHLCIEYSDFLEINCFCCLPTAFSFFLPRLFLYLMIGGGVVTVELTVPLTCGELQRHVFTPAKLGFSTFAVMSLESLCNSVTL